MREKRESEREEREREKREKEREEREREREKYHGGEETILTDIVKEQLHIKRALSEGPPAQVSEL